MLGTKYFALLYTYLITCIISHTNVTFLVFDMETSNDFSYNDQIIQTPQTTN